MPWTNYPNGVSVTTQTGVTDGLVNATAITVVSNTATAAGSITVGTVSATGAISRGAYQAEGDVNTFSHKVPYSGVGEGFAVALTSALYNSSALNMAPFKCLPEIVYVQAATASITVSVRVTAGSVSTATDIATLTVGSATNIAVNTAYTTIGGTVIGQGSYFHLTSAVQATVNSSNLYVYLIPVA